MTQLLNLGILVQDDGSVSLVPPTVPVTKPTIQIKQEPKSSEIVKSFKSVKPNVRGIKVMATPTEVIAQAGADFIKVLVIQCLSQAQQGLERIEQKYSAEAVASVLGAHAADYAAVKTGIVNIVPVKK